MITGLLLCHSCLLMDVGSRIGHTLVVEGCEV